MRSGYFARTLSDSAFRASKEYSSLNFNLLMGAFLCNCIPDMETGPSFPSSKSRGAAAKTMTKKIIPRRIQRTNPSTYQLVGDAHRENGHKAGISSLHPKMPRRLFESQNLLCYNYTPAHYQMESSFASS